MLLGLWTMIGNQTLGTPVAVFGGLLGTIGVGMMGYFG